MSGPGRLRRVKEWAWRTQHLQELRQRSWGGTERQLLEEATSCHKLAWRTLAGVEPIPASTRGAVAKPLLLAGITKCLALVQPPLVGVAQLFEDPIWQGRLTKAGIDGAAQPAVRSWLLEVADASRSPAASQQALLALRVVLDTLLAESHAIRRVIWRRIRVLGALLTLLVGVAASLVLLLSPPEGPDLGLGKPWQASSFYPGFPGSGIKTAKPSETAFFSTNEDADPWWRIDLGSPTNVSSVTVVNRADCCPDRAIPLALELSLDGQKWREVSRRTTSFRTWSPKFKPTKTRYVRLRGLRKTFIHFKDVRVHG